MAGSPRIIARPTTRSPAACRRARVRQGQAFGGAEEAPSLTAAAPRRRWKYAVGTEECSRRGSNQRMECKGRPDWRDAPLTKKAPYKPYALMGPVRFCAGGRSAMSVPTAIHPGYVERLPPAPVHPQPLIGIFADPALDHRRDRLHRSLNVDLPGGIADRLHFFGQFATKAVSGQADDA